MGGEKLICYDADTHQMGECGNLSGNRYAIPEPYRIPDDIKVYCKDCEDFAELKAAAKGVLPYLPAPSDRIEWFGLITLEVRPIPTELENAQKEVERLKAKDAAIKRFREAIRKVEGKQ